MGACIGVSFALALAEARPGLVSALVLQNPIGLGGEPRGDRRRVRQVGGPRCATGPTSIAAQLPGFHQRMFGGEFIFSVSTRIRAQMRDSDAADAGRRHVHPAAKFGRARARAARGDRRAVERRGASRVAAMRASANSSSRTSPLPRS